MADVIAFSIRSIWVFPAFPQDFVAWLWYVRLRGTVLGGPAGFVLPVARNITCSEVTSLEQPEMAVGFLLSARMLVCWPRTQLAPPAQCALTWKGASSGLCLRQGKLNPSLTPEPRCDLARRDCMGKTYFRMHGCPGPATLPLKCLPGKLGPVQRQLETGPQAISSFRLMLKWYPQWVRQG